MVERLAAHLGRRDKDTQVFDNLLLPAEIFKSQGAEGLFKLLLLVVALFSYVKIFHDVFLIFSLRPGAAKLPLHITAGGAVEKPGLRPQHFGHRALHIPASQPRILAGYIGKHHHRGG